MNLSQYEIFLLLDEDIKRCAKQYIAKQNREEHPKGSFDNGGRWYPDDSEKLNTEGHRSQSRQFPYSYLLACRSLEHVAYLYDITEKDKILAIKRVAKALKSDTSIEAFIAKNSKKGDI